MPVYSKLRENHSDSKNIQVKGTILERKGKIITGAYYIYVTRLESTEKS